MNNELINACTHAVICTHVNPDGDAIGSSLALKHYLERKGKQATVIVPNIFPDFLKWLPGADSILIYTNEKHQEQIKSAIAEADLVKIVGREYVGLGLVKDKCFCRVTMHT